MGFQGFRRIRVCRIYEWPNSLASTLTMTFWPTVQWNPWGGARKVARGLFLKRIHKVGQIVGTWRWSSCSSSRLPRSACPTRRGRCCCWGVGEVKIPNMCCCSVLCLNDPPRDAPPTLITCTPNTRGQGGGHRQGNEHGFAAVFTAGRGLPRAALAAVRQGKRSSDCERPKKSQTPNPRGALTLLLGTP